MCTMCQRSITRCAPNFHQFTSHCLPRLLLRVLPHPKFIKVNPGVTTYCITQIPVYIQYRRFPSLFSPLVHSDVFCYLGQGFFTLQFSYRPIVSVLLIAIGLPSFHPIPSLWSNFLTRSWAQKLSSDYMNSSHDDTIPSTSSRFASYIYTHPRCS